MKILFIMQEIDYFDPLGLMSIIAVAKKEGHETFLGILAHEDILAKIEKIRPELVAYSASTGEHKYYFEINRKIKEKHPEIFTIMGGPHVTFFPYSLREGDLDAVCIGEGEEAFTEFLKKFEARQDLSGMQNIMLKDAKDCPPVRPLCKDFDSLAFPDRDLIYRNTDMGPFPLKSFMTSRGCPYTCTYCFNHAFRKLYKGEKPIRRHSVDYVIEEIQNVRKNYPLRFIKFYDDVFTIKYDEWFEEFVRKYKDKIRLPFHILMRADNLTEDIARGLKEAGCKSVSMSIEAANDNIRINLIKRNMTKETMVNAFQMCKKYRINTFSNNILGLPTSTIQDDIDLVDFNIKCGVTFAEFPIYHPYPGTELGDYCKDNGMFAGDYNSLHMSYMNLSPLNSFSDHHKEVQKNLGELGLLAMTFPWLKKWIFTKLIYKKHSFLFFLSYFLLKSWYVTMKIYPFRYDLRTILKIASKSLRLEKFKHTGEKKPAA
jgi:anaerobic magnesium-protoporphyrin IX monomethyl ester cyclase